MDTLGRVIKRVASGSVSTSNRFAQLEALDALSGQVWLTSDLNHLAEEAVYRPLAAHAGFIDLQCGSLAFGTELPFRPSEFLWIGRFDDTPAPATACFGSFVVSRLASDSTRWPRLVMRARVVPPSLSTDHLNVCLAVVPGYPSAATASYAYAFANVPGNGAAWTDLTLSITLTADAVASVSSLVMAGLPASGVPPVAEQLNANVFTAYFSAGTTTGKCTIAGITLGLEP